MDDLISRQAVLDDFMEIRYTLQMMDDTHTADKMMAGLRRAEISVMEAPSAERSGKWNFIRMEKDGSGNGFYKCSCCGKGGIHAPEVKVSYCWNCGAKMEGDE